MLFPTKMCSFQFFFLYDLIMFLFSPLNQQESLFMDFWHHWPGGHYINSFNQRKALLWSPRILISEKKKIFFCTKNSAVGLKNEFQVIFRRFFGTQWLIKYSCQHFPDEKSMGKRIKDFPLFVFVNITFERKCR